MQTWPALRNLNWPQMVRDRLDVDVVADDHRAVAAELHRAALHGLRRRRHQLLADGSRAGQRNLAHRVGRHDHARDRRRLAGDELDRIGRDAALEAALDEDRGDRGRLLGRAADDRASGGERRGDLAGEQVDREVPRGERRDDADRLVADDQLAALPRRQACRRTAARPRRRTSRTARALPAPRRATAGRGGRPRASAPSPVRRGAPPFGAPPPRSTLARSHPGIRLHVFCPAAAVAIASSTSAGVAAGVSPSTSSVAGLSTGDTAVRRRHRASVRR